MMDFALKYHHVGLCFQKNLIMLNIAFRISSRGLFFRFSSCWILLSKFYYVRICCPHSGYCFQNNIMLEIIFRTSSCWIFFSERYHVGFCFQNVIMLDILFRMSSCWILLSEHHHVGYYCHFFQNGIKLGIFSEPHHVGYYFQNVIMLDITFRTSSCWILLSERHHTLDNTLLNYYYYVEYSCRNSLMLDIS